MKREILDKKILVSAMIRNANICDVDYSYRWPTLRVKQTPLIVTINVVIAIGFFDKEVVGRHVDVRIRSYLALFSGESDYVQIWGANTIGDLK